MVNGKRNYYDAPVVSLKDYIDPRRFRTVLPECRDLSFGKSEVPVVTELKKDSVLYRKNAIPEGFGKAMFIYGYVTVIDFCNQEVGHSMKYSIDHYRSDKIEGKVACDYALHVTLFEPKDEIANEIAKLPEYGVSTCKMFMAYKGHDYHCDDDVVLKALKVAGPAGVTTMLHCENADMIDVLQK